MQKYIGTKIVLAVTMTYAQFKESTGLTLPTASADADDGYLVEYTDGGKPNHPDHKGYISWSPKDVFERAYHLHQERDLSETLPSFVTEESIKAKIKNVSYHVFEGTTLTHCTITLENGYTVTGESACVRPENFNKAVGEEWAYKDAFKHLWKLEGYLLKQRLFEGDQLDAGLPSSNIKRDNSLTLSQMLLEHDAVMNSGIDPENTSVEELAAHQDKYVAMIEFAKATIENNHKV